VKCTECSRVIRPVVAVDIDGTLGDYHRHFTDFAGRYMGRGVGREYTGDRPFNEALGIDKQTYRQIKLAYRQGGMKRSMPVYPQAIWFMDQLRAMDVELWIATTRPYLRLDNIDPDTREWMRRHGIVADGILYDEDKYERLVELVDPERILVVVDDLLEQCQMADKLGLGVIQVARDHNVGSQWMVRRGDMKGIARHINSLVVDWKDRNADVDG
jgi:hypothetical protein